MPEQQEPPPLSWCEKELDKVLGPAYQWGLCERLPDKPDPQVVEKRREDVGEEAAKAIE